MAPEVVLGLTYTKSCDVYSLGIIMVNLLFGKSSYTSDELKLLSSPVKDLLMNMLQMESSRISVKDVYQRTMKLEKSLVTSSKVSHELCRKN